MPKKKSSIVKFDLSKLSIIKDGDKFIFDPKAEKILLDWEMFKDAVNEADEELRHRLMQTMTENKTIKVDGNDITVSRRVYGNKYKIVNREQAQGFYEEQIKYKVLTREVDDYLKETGTLPDGIEPNARKESVTIRIKKG